MKPAKDSFTRIYLLGRFEVSREEKQLRAGGWSRRKAAGLLKCLAVNKRLVRDQAIDLFWPDSDLESGANNLYRTLHELRQTLNTSLGPDTDDSVIQFADGVLSLAPSVWVDAAEFERLCAKPTERIESLEQAVALYQGDLLPDDLYEEWTVAPRESLRRRYRDACLALAALYRDARQYERAFPLLAPLLAYDKADEPVHRELMRAHALAGRRHHALRQYQACVQALASELDLTPEPETAALYTQILDGRLAPPPQPMTTTQTSYEAVPDRIQASPLMVGREREFEMLRRWLESVPPGHGRTILIAGESGIGKTHLAGEILCASAGVGIQTLIGAAPEQEGQLPYQPFIEALDRFLSGGAHSPIENPITHFQTGASGDLQRDQFALFNATARLLRELAMQAPILLFIDDLHAADEASLHLFHFLARQLRTTPVTLLATYRTDLPSSLLTPFGSLLNALYREHLSETLNLSPLTAEATSRLLSQILGDRVAPPLIEAVHEIAEGNPFFIQEIARSLQKSDHILLQEGGWSLHADAEFRISMGLEGLLRERVARLGAQVESMLISGAVLGREFDFEILRSMTSLSDGDLLDALDEALEAHLLEETPTGYRFRHALIRRALYDSLSRARRARLHSRAAEAIEATFAIHPHGPASRVEDLAYHFNLSDRRDRALEYLIQAGQKAAGLFAFEVAVGHFEQALALMDALALRDPARRWMILESLGSWHTILANTPRAVEYFERAIALPAMQGWASAPHERIRLHCSAANTLITAGDMHSAEAHLNRALVEANEQTGMPELADLFYNLALLHWHRDEYQQAFESAQRSLDIAERAGRTEAIARAFEMLALACHSLGEWQTGLSFEQKRASLTGAGLDVTDAFDVHL